MVPRCFQIEFCSILDDLSNAIEVAELSLTLFSLPLFIVHAFRTGMHCSESENDRPRSFPMFSWSRKHVTLGWSAQSLLSASERVCIKLQTLLWNVFQKRHYKWDISVVWKCYTFPLPCLKCIFSRHPDCLHTWHIYPLAQHPFSFKSPLMVINRIICKQCKFLGKLTQWNVHPTWGSTSSWRLLSCAGAASRPPSRRRGRPFHWRSCCCYPSGWRT